MPQVSPPKGTRQGETTWDKFCCEHENEKCHRFHHLRGRVREKSVLLRTREWEMSQVSPPKGTRQGEATWDKFCCEHENEEYHRSWTSLDPDVCDARFMSPQSLLKTSQLLFIFVHWKVKRHLQARSKFVNNENAAQQAKLCQMHHFDSQIVRFLNILWPNPLVSTLRQAFS